MDHYYIVFTFCVSVALFLSLSPPYKNAIVKIDDKTGYVHFNMTGVIRKIYLYALIFTNYVLHAVHVVYVCACTGNPNMPEQNRQNPLRIEDFLLPYFTFPNPYQCKGKEYRIRFYVDFHR